MNEPVMLVSGPLGRLAHHQAPPEITVWLRTLLVAKRKVIIPEISDYEIRRSLLLHGRQRSLGVLEPRCFAPPNFGLMPAAAGIRPPIQRNSTPT